MLVKENIQVPRYAVFNRDANNDPMDSENDLIEYDDNIEIDGQIFTKPFVEKPVSAEDHNIYIYYPMSAGGGCQILFRKIGSRSSVYSSESRVRRTGSYIYEKFMATAGTDVKVCFCQFLSLIVCMKAPHFLHPQTRADFVKIAKLTHKVQSDYL